MSRATQAISEIVEQTGVRRLLTHARSKMIEEIALLCYHRVVDHGQYVDGTNVSCSVEQFEEQLDFLKRNYQVITFREVIDCLKEDKRFPERSLLLTFDDGFRDNYMNAFGLLKKYELPAAFFVVSSLIGTNNSFWFDEVAFTVAHAPVDYVELPGGFRFALGGSGEAQIEARTVKLLSHLKGLTNEDRLAAVSLIAECLPKDKLRTDAEYSMPMTWDELREMSAAGMEVYSHTHTHALLSQVVDPREIRWELEESKKIIERELGTLCDVIAFPVGTPIAYDQRSIETALELGYQLACTTNVGTNKRKSFEPMELKRFFVDRTTTTTNIAARLTTPRLFSY